MKTSFEANRVIYRRIDHPVVGLCLDGTAPEYIDSAIASGHMPVVKKFRDNGWYTQAVSVMPSFTNPNNIAIATGTLPEKNGICGNYFYDKASDREIMMNEPEFLRASSLFEAAFHAGRRVAVVTAKDKLLRLLSKGWEGVAFSGEYADRATVEGIGNVAEKLGEPPPHYSDARINRYTLAAAFAVFEVYRPDILYISLTDCVQHRAAPGEEEANTMLSEIDEFIGRFVQRGARLGFTADHGMNYKIKPDGTPNVIYLGEILSALGADGCRIILPITDPYVSHHSALGSFATIYCAEDLVGGVKNRLLGLNGVTEVLERREACKKYALPADRIGDLVIIADQDTVLGKTPKDHDLSLLKAPLRSHGGLAETLAP